MNTSNPYDGERKPGSVGLPLPDVQIRITEGNSKIPLPSKEVGMIQVKGPNVFSSYCNNDLANQESFTDDGFFITGDIGYVDQDGYVHISGREKDLIISGGFNIYPKEIEDLINNHPDVKESAVVRVKDDDLGEVPVAVIVVDMEFKAQVLSDLENIFQQNLAKFKVPREIKILDELPRNAMGKIQKNSILNLIT